MHNNNVENNASLCYMLATEYLWMSTCECITVGGPLSICVPSFRSHLEITALPHTRGPTLAEIVYEILIST